MKTFKTVDDYINSFPEEVRSALVKFRHIVQTLAPGASEGISYGMPGYKINGKPLVYFAGWKNHISFYPTPSGMGAYEKELEKYRTGKGTAQFPLQDPIPYTLIENIVKFRLKELEEKNK